MPTIQRSKNHRPPDQTFANQASKTLLELRSALAELLPAIPAGVRRAADLQRALKLDATLSWQVFKLAESPDPITVAGLVPGAASMKRFLDAAKRQVPTELVNSAAEAFANFESMVHTHAGNRTAFCSMIGGVSSEGAEQVDLKHKRNAFRANAHFWGVQDRCGISCTLFAPNSEVDNAMDIASNRGRIGLWRARPGPPLVLSRIELSGEHSSYKSSFQREPLDPDAFEAHGVSLVRAFCSDPTPQVRSNRIASNTVQTELLTDAVGRTAAVTCVLGDVSRGVPRPQASGDDYLDVRYNVRFPSEVVLHDVLIHKSILGKASASVLVFGDQRVGDRPPVERHPSDQLDVNESVSHLGQNIESLFTADAPRYVELVRWAMTRLGWNEGDFHVYRCRVDYPIMATTIDVRLRQA